MSICFRPATRLLVAWSLTIPLLAGCGQDPSDSVGQLQEELRLSAGDPEGHLIRHFEELPRQLTYSVPEGEATATLVPSHEVYRSVDGRLTFPINPSGTCATLDVVEGRSSAQWTLAVKQRGAVLDCESELATIWDLKDPNDALPGKCPKECNYCLWKWNGPGNGWRRTCVIIASGIP